MHKNFKPDLWSKLIQKNIDKLCVLHEDCNFPFDGEIKYKHRIKILGARRPAIGYYLGEDVSNCHDPLHLSDYNAYINIDYMKTFNFMVDNVDKAQGIDGLMEKLTEEIAGGLAEAGDIFVASLTPKAGALSTSTKITTSDGAQSAVDAAFLYLWENNVELIEQTTIIITTWFYNLFKDKLTDLCTDLTKKNIIVGLYNGIPVKLSDNLYNDGTDDYMMIKTKKAFAFAGQIEKIEAYRPSDLFTDTIRGAYVYGAEVVRPEELYIIRAHEA